MGDPTGFHIDIDHGTCERCAACVSVCPTRALVIEGLALACHDPRCVGCDMCVVLCPVACLTLEPVASTPAAAK